MQFVTPAPFFNGAAPYLIWRIQCLSGFLLSLPHPHPSPPPEEEGNLKVSAYPPEGEGNRYVPPPSRGRPGGGWGICRSSIKFTIT
jgi:hypothetical protein